MPRAAVNEQSIDKYDEQIDQMYARCHENAPNFGVPAEQFRASVKKTLGKFLQASTESATDEQVREFLDQLQIDELFLALACANGNERAWWEFDHQHRAHLERVSRQLAKTEIDAQEVIDCVYVELYGTRVVDGARVSKFATYSGRGSLRGWLRTVIWHSLVDLHRASHDELSLDEMTETLGEGAVHAGFAVQAPGGENAEIEQITRNRYRDATSSAIAAAFAALENHEKLLLLYYHVEQMKLREIAKLLEDERSPLRGWFQRRIQNPDRRIHESTIMRWLEKSYSRVLQYFKEDLESRQGLTGPEIEACLELVNQDFSGESLFRNLTNPSAVEKF